MIITADISMYPLDSDFIPPITEFIKRLRSFPGLEIVINQLSTQLRGEFETRLTPLLTFPPTHTSRWLSEGAASSLKCSPSSLGIQMETVTSGASLRVEG